LRPGGALVPAALSGDCRMGCITKTEELSVTLNIRITPGVAVSGIAKPCQYKSRSLLCSMCQWPVGVGNLPSASLCRRARSNSQKGNDVDQARTTHQYSPAINCARVNFALSATCRKDSNNSRNGKTRAIFIGCTKGCWRSVNVRPPCAVPDREPYSSANAQTDRPDVHKLTGDFPDVSRVGRDIA